MHLSRDGSGAGSAPGSDERPLERFTPTSGSVIGWFGIAIAVGTVGYLAVTDHSLVSLRVCLGAAIAGLVVWMTQVRPRVTTYPTRLRIHGSASDTYVPYVAISEVTLGQTLNVWVGRKRYVCVGIGRSVGLEMRQRVRSHNTGGLMGGNRSYQFAGKQEVTPGAAATGAAATQAYLTHIVDRIDDLVASSRGARDRATEDDLAVRHRLAVPEVSALVVLGLAFVATLFL